MLIAGFIKTFRHDCRFGHISYGWYGILSAGVRVITGDGDSCDVLQNCDINARCVFDDSIQGYTCRCNSGYTGKLIPLVLCR